MKGVDLTDDGTAVITLEETVPGGLVLALAGSEMVSIVHQVTGVRISCPLKYEREGAIIPVPNHGNLLKPGDTVLVVIGKLSSTAVVNG